MPQASQEEITEEETVYHKRIEDLLEDAEIEAEIETEKKIRSKNTRLVTISLIAAALLGLLYLQVKTGFESSSPEGTKIINEPELAKAPVVEPSPAAPQKDPKAAETPQTENKTTAPTPGDEKVETPKATETATEPPEPAPSSPANTAVSVEKQQAPVVAQTPPKVPSKAPAPEPKKIAEVAKVTKKPVKPSPIAVAPASSARQYHVQLGVFSVEDNAKRMLNKIKAKGFKPSIKTKSTETSMYVVFLGGFSNTEDGNQAISELKSKGFSPVMEQFAGNSNTIVLGKFKNVDQAADLRDKLSIHGFLSSAQKSPVQTKLHIVQLGPFSSQSQAQKTKNAIDRSGFKSSFIR